MKFSVILLVHRKHTLRHQTRLLSSDSVIWQTVPPVIIDYIGHRQTLLHVREINLKACTPVILKQFILPGLGIEPRPV